MNLLITASLLSELNLVLRFFKPTRIYQNKKIKIFKTHNDNICIYFSITGVGEKNIHSFINYIKSRNLLPSIWISIGYAGAINPSLKAGELLLAHSVVLPEGKVLNVRVPDTLLEVLQELNFCSCYYTTALMDRDEKLKLLGEKLEICSVDMESGPIAVFCNENKIPLCIIRSISDTVYFKFPDISILKQGNELKFKLKSINPFNLFRLFLLQRNMRRAGKSLFKIVKRIILYINYFSDNS